MAELVLEFVEPRAPDVKVHPVFGVISHTTFPFVQAALPLGGTIVPAVPVLVNVTVLFTHMVSFGEIEKSASAFFEILIPPMVPGVSPQGLEMIYETVNVLLGGVPQLLESKI